MPSKLFCSILFLCILNFCKAQDSTIVLDTSMFDQNFQVINLTGLNGWIFKEGNDTGWAKNDLDTKSWKKFNPPGLTVKNADKNGRVEGWFRLKFTFDSSFRNFPVGIFSNRWAASDLYIDGQHTASFGNTGLNGKPYEENRTTKNPPISLNLQVNIVHILALHIVDYVSPVNLSNLKTQDNEDQGGYGGLIVLTGANSHVKWIEFLTNLELYFTFFSCVCGVLSILFWLLYFQNRNEKNLSVIALGTMLFSATAFLVKMDQSSGISDFANLMYKYTWNFILGLATAINLIILANIFKRKISILVVVYCIFSSFSFITDLYFFEGKTFPLLYALNVCVFIYLIITSWRKLRGPQWVVVAGILLSFISGFIYGYYVTKFKSPSYPLSYFYLTGTFLSFPLSLMVYVASRFKEILNEVRANAKELVKITEEKKEILAHQNELLEKQVEERTRELKASQAQLIQSEKMASLGELTAGIAHEIQNPLNFVNNFSEVNKELLAELNEEIAKGNYEEVKIIAKDVIGNEEKISHHGKRADAIVKGMLQHSRSSSATKEPTDINKLADEYLRLAYHGLRAKDKEFNATMKTDYDETIGNVNVIPQDIGRVLLNLYNNAFYAVAEKKKQQSDGYEPIVSVSTNHSLSFGEGRGEVRISVKDNGNGIPKKVLDKIFQPFFTTKPTGQGTGLGLSLSYDIVKAHGGEIKVDTKEGEGTEFIISLSIV